MTAATMMERCQKMKQQKQDMKDDIKAQDAQLTEQLANMNRAPEDQKTGIMAAVLTHMVEQRIAMDARKAQMEEAMMQHMMQHMQMGKESMSQCPMMKGMKDMDDKSAGSYREQKWLLSVTMSTTNGAVALWQLFEMAPLLPATVRMTTGGWSQRSERDFMMNHDGWMGGWMGGGMWPWAVLITVLLVVLLVVVLNKRPNK
jgi:hypothetical protein